MTTPVQPERQGSRFAWPEWTGRQWLEALFVAGLAPALFLAAVVLAGFDNRWVDLLAQFGAPALIGAVVLTVGLGLLRMRAAGLLSTLFAVLLAFMVWPQWFPAGPAADPEAPVVRLYSANLFHLNNDTAAIRRSIEAANPDIIVLIELGEAPRHDLDRLLEGYPHRSISMPPDREQDRPRSLIASRWPLTARAATPPGLQAVAVTSQTPLGPIDVVGVHLTRPWPFQNSWGQISQTMALDDLVRGLNGPVIAAGDFNSVSAARIGKQIRRDIGLRPAPGFPGTWPAGLPSVLGLTIDHVYASPDLAFVSRRLGDATGSDHRPVVTEITRAAD
jgi:endonuclease/exonuclease/phosphatase (EEP) superfamily protein YafD